MTPLERRSYADRVRGQICAPIDVEADDVEREFAHCELKPRLVEGSWVGPYYRTDVFYKGEWRSVGKTSLFDDVATGWCDRTPEESLAHAEHAVHNNFGARLFDNGESYCVSFITHMTDG